MSTGNILGFAGLAVGAFFGGPVGAQIGLLAGTLIGNLIDPPKIEGPRLNDLKLQKSAYGQVIPIVYGTGRIAGNVIDQTDLQEHKNKSRGGKGGPVTITYTYSASFDILLCEGPIIGILRIWADGRLIWAQSTGEPCPCTVYLGSDDQDVDPTFEAIHGVGNVPAYNGLAHVVFTDYFLTDFGNRIPQLEFEVFTKAGAIPWRVSTFSPWPDDTGALTGSASYSGGVVTTGVYTDYPATKYRQHQYDIDGNEIDSGTVESVITGYIAGVKSTVRNVAGLAVFQDPPGGAYAWYQGANPSIMIPVGPPVANQSIYQDGYVYTVLDGATVACFRVPDGAPDGTSSSPNATYTLDSTYTVSQIALGTSNDGSVWVRINASEKLWKLDLDLNLVHFWDSGTTPAYPTSLFSNLGDYNFHVYNDLICFDRLDATDGRVASVVGVNDDYTFTFVGHTPAHSGPRITLGGGLVLTYDGVISLDPPAMPELLSDIIADISDRTTLDGAYDVDELANDDVRWFAIGSQMTARNAIQSLRPVFFFDAVEEDDQIVFYKRGGTSVAAIPDEDLCAHEDGGDGSDPLLTIRTREQALPRTVTMTYYDVDMDYQIGAQSSPRQTTLSEQDVSVDAPVGLTAQEAAQKCWAVQSAEWIGRESFEFQLTLKWDRLMPCTVVSVRGRELRILTKTAAPNGVLSFTGQLSAPSIYTQSAPGATGEGFVPQEAAGDNVRTELVLLDIPILSQHDAPFGFYAAMGPAIPGRWPGATLFKSLDGGVVYSDVAASNIASVIGTTSSASGSPSVSGTLAAYSGGDVVDESEVCVVLTDADAELESCTATALTNGANLCAISNGSGGSPATTQWELLQFRDATLVADRTYVLKGFLRGRKETSTGGHAEGDRFVLLPVTNVDAPEAELNHEYKYKAVTAGLSLADTPAQDFTNTGLATTSFYETEANHLPVYGQNSGGSPTQLLPGLVPPPHAAGCDPDYFLNECGEWVVPTGSGGGGSPSGGSGAPTDAQYLVMVSDSSLTAERVAQGSSNVSLTEAGSPGSSVTFDLTDTGVVAGNYGDTFNIPVLTIDAKGRVTSATNATVVGQIVTESEGGVVDLNAQVLNFTGAGVDAYDDGYGITVIEVKGPFVVLSVAYAASVTVDLAAYSAYAVVVINVGVLTGPITFDLTNGTDGQIIRVRFTQDGVGGRTFTAGGHLRFSDDIPSVTLSTGANKLDHVAFEWTGSSGSPTSDFADHVANNLGFH